MTALLLLLGLFWINDSQFCYTQVSPGVYTDCVNKVGEQVFSDEYTSFTIDVWSDGKKTWAGNPYAQELGVIGLSPTLTGIGAAWLLGHNPATPASLEVK